jgi:ATP-dependent protease ClpP protease subunit
VRSQDGTCVIALQGLISHDATLKFEDVASRSGKRGCAKPWLMLESPGGLLRDGLGLGRDVRMQGFRTITRYECASACAMIFLGGTERVLVGSRAKIGLHQPASVRTVGNSRRCGGTIDSNGVRDMRGYLRWVIPAEADQVMSAIMSTSCDTMDWTYGKRALELGIATSVESEGVDVFGPKAAKQQPAAKAQ